MFYLLIFVFIAGAVLLIALGLAKQDQVTILDNPRLFKEAPKTKIRRLRFLSKVFPFTGLLLEKFKLGPKIKNRLDAAHLKLSPEEFFNLKIIFIVTAVLLSPALLGGLDPVKIAIAAGFAYLAPEIWLNSKIKQRKDSIRRFLPETVDLLGLCVEAGLDFTSSIDWLVRKGILSNHMIDELAFVMVELSWGKPRAQALKDMGKRLNIPEINSFVQTLVQAERMGTPVSEAFAILSEDARLQRFHQGERYAMKAPIKILIPLIFCILPVIGIIIGGPIFLQFMQGSMLKSF